MDSTPDHGPERDIAERKAAIRRSMRERLDSMDGDERHRRSVEACRRLVGLDTFRNAACIMLYMPLPTEVDLTPAALACFRQGVQVCVPTVDWDRQEMRVVETTSFDDEVMDIDERGLRTPRAGRPIPLEMIDVIIVPGLAFDGEGHRLGRGGGFYDRFLRRLSSTPPLIGLAFDDQVVESVPIETHDHVLDAVVTDRRVAFRNTARV